jgi:hypothetical protein
MEKNLLFSTNDSIFTFEYYSILKWRLLHFCMSTHLEKSTPKWSRPRRWMARRRRSGECWRCDCFSATAIGFSIPEASTLRLSFSPPATLPCNPCAFAASVVVGQPAAHPGGCSPNTQRRNIMCNVVRACGWMDGCIALSLSLSFAP